jgi:hypothetical protein
VHVIQLTSRSVLGSPITAGMDEASDAMLQLAYGPRLNQTRAPQSEAKRERGISPSTCRSLHRRRRRRPKPDK